MSPRNVVVFALLIAAALGSWYLSRQNAADDDEGVFLDKPYRGYYLKTARILGTSPDGSLLYEIEAARAEQRSDDSIEFSEVRIAYSPASDIPWVIDADTATLFPQLERVLLKGHVRAVDTRGLAEGDTEIRTQILTLDPNLFTAQTDEHVQIRIGERSLTATGMLASLSDNRLQLESNVSGKFVP
jgi:LPS export ABC transporter protein LptC